MKIAVTAQTDSLDSMVDPRFGRCRFFVVVDSETMDFKSLSNESNMATGGAGIQAAQMIARSRVARRC